MNSLSYGSSGRGFQAGVITLDSANGAYWAGSRVAGTFQFTLDAPLTFQAINVVYQGEGQVSWSDSESQTVGRSERTVQVHYRGRENYFQFMQTVAGGNGMVTTLRPGTHKFDFHYQMPAKIPSSFEHNLGYVRYTVAATLDFGSMGPPSPHADVVKLFTVITPFDLNLEPDAQVPINFEFEEAASGCGFCAGGSYNVKLSMPHTGYCPGQLIPIDIVVDNDSSIEVQKIYIYLRKKLEFHSSEPRSDMGEDEEVLLRVKRGPVPSRSKRSVRAEVEVPAELCMNTQNCSLIDITYYLKVEIKLSGCNEDCSDDADLIIGTIPLSGSHAAGYRHPLHDQLPAGPPPTAEAVPSVVYPTNTPYPTPMQNYPGSNDGYPGQPYPGNLGFNLGDHPPPPPPYSSYPDAPSPGYPGGTHSSGYPGSDPAPYPAYSPYPAAPYPVPDSNNASHGWSKSGSTGAPSAPCL